MKFAILLLALVACAADAPLPNQAPGYPCGVVGVVCAASMCCPQYTTCGGAFPSVGCPADECCYIGNGDMMAKRPVPQTPAARR